MSWEQGRVEGLSKEQSDMVDAMIGNWQRTVANQKESINRLIETNRGLKDRINNLLEVIEELETKLGETNA